MRQTITIVTCESPRNVKVNVDMEVSSLHGVEQELVSGVVDAVELGLIDGSVSVL